MAAESYTTDEEVFIRQSYEKSLWIDQKTYQDGMHDSIADSIFSLSEREIEEIFGIRSPTRVLSEGENIKEDIRVEDFAITGSYAGGEMAIGQIVSCNGKPPRGDMPGDFNQAHVFGDLLDDYPGLDIDITGQYVIRTKNSAEQVRSRNKLLEKDIALYGGTGLDVEIYELEPYEKNIEEALEVL